MNTKREAEIMQAQATRRIRIMVDKLVRWLNQIFASLNFPHEAKGES